MPFWLIILLAAVFGGSVPTLAKYALGVFPSFCFLFIRSTVALVVLLPFVVKSKELNIKIGRQLSLVGIIGALNPALLFVALKFTQASVSPLIYASVPILTTLYVSYKKIEKVSKQRLIGIFVGLLGVVIIVLLPLIATGVTQELSLRGNLLIMVATVAFTAYGISSKQKQEKIKATSISLTFYPAFFSLLISLPLAIYELERGMVVWAQVTGMHWLSAITTGLVGTTLFYLVYQHGVKKGGATAGSLFVYFQPIIGVSLSAVLLRETITLPFVVGGLLTVLGAQLAMKKE